MISVIATIELVAGQREAFLNEFRKIVPKVRAEAGCVEYGPWIDVPSGIPAQESFRENSVIVIEKWADLAALKAHLVAPHMLDYRPRVKAMVAGVRLQVLEPAKEIPQ